MSFFDLIYPKRCAGCRKFGAYVCSTCFTYITFTDHGFCTICQKNSIDGLTHPVCSSKFEIDGVFASVVYVGVVKRLIRQFKYSPYVTDMKNIIEELFYEGVIQKELFTGLLSKKCVFVPIPLHKTRMRQRGYNQSKVLTEGLVKKIGNEIYKSHMIEAADLLERIKETRPQYGLSQQDRLVNMAGAFTIKQKHQKSPEKDEVILLIDDIVTTGATFREAGRVLKRAGYKSVFGVAFAHGK